MRELRYKGHYRHYNAGGTIPSRIGKLLHMRYLEIQVGGKSRRWHSERGVVEMEIMKVLNKV